MDKEAPSDRKARCAHALGLLGLVYKEKHDPPPQSLMVYQTSGKPPGQKAGRLGGGSSPCPGWEHRWGRPGASQHLLSGRCACGITEGAAAEVGTSAWVASQPGKGRSRMWSGECLGPTLGHRHHPRK